VAATVTSTGYSGSASGTLTIAKVTPSFSNLSAPSINQGTASTTLSGTIKSGMLVPGGNVSITLNGVTQTAAISSAGNFSTSFATAGLTASGSPYTISYSYAGDTNFNSVSDSSKTLTINTISATVTLGNLNQTYSGTAKSATVTTNPSGLSVSTTYNGSATLPVNAGSYNVAATVTSTGYSGSASGTLTIAKVTPSFSNLSAPSINQGTASTTLSGTIKSGMLVPGGNVSITLNGVTQTAAISSAGNFSTSFTTAGLTASESPYTISYSYAGDTNFNSASDSSKTLTVNQTFEAWDVDMDNNVNVLDMISVSQNWGRTGAANWIRADVNGDGKVNVLDLIMIGQHWSN